MSIKLLKMKKISLILGMALMAITFTSCEDESLDSQNNVVQSKSGFNAESTYWSIVNDLDEGYDIFNALTNTEKQQVWSVKFDVFVDNEVLNAAQISAVEELKTAYLTYNFDEPSEDPIFQLEVNDIFADFDSNIGIGLVGTIDNDPDNQGQPSNEPLGDRYTGYTYELNAPCHGQVIAGVVFNDSPVETITVRRYRRGRLIEERKMDVPCGTYGFQTAE